MNAEHVCKKFPNHIEAIQSIWQRDAAFREICVDYAEVCTWLDGYCRLIGRPSKECDHARQLMWELEVEIIQVLKEAGINLP